jgi:adenosylhomocysteine nucleosidase
MEAHLLPKIYIYTALPCEAKPLVDFYRLKKDTNITSFAIYRNNHICLTVTGIGKTAMAAGIAYTQALFSTDRSSVMFNLGIAGHQQHHIGNLFLIDKITDTETERRYYPPLVFSPPCPTHSLQTVSKPQLSYPLWDLCDMEASAFYETATRFSSGELVQCVKIVSDNEISPALNVEPKQVSKLISDRLSTIETLLAELTRLAELIKPQELIDFDQIVNQYHFTGNEQIQLKKLLSRWQLLTGKNRVDTSVATAKNSKEYLALLTRQLSEVELYL